MIGGVIAIAYPANVIDIYPIISYRLVNFYMLHGAFILFALMILYEKDLMSIPRLKKNILIVTCMFVSVFFFNLIFHTQYMFVGTPPTIPIIHMVYEICGKLMFLPVVIILVSLIQSLVYFMIRKIQIFVYNSKRIA